ncbi:MATE family multidrug resistance protein [Novosphingobium chloroacetimidivorans]|uniref:MATE family multidrug resistance protein n=1 Tax=Novosphingobium chloroacetimidivorans TaxID=1428314 RepID=A0A7W7KA37_9SPHN|nr:MATE family efflux transporter [Novosphingobium chloroacetimidivorans]MBB4858489.1 MATE family multidrug resistance protein [Novosphingobium chloroacetimidivorans]
MKGAPGLHAGIATTLRKVDAARHGRHPACVSIAPSPSPARMVWAIALPAMLTNVATALFGLADMWTIGQLGNAPAQGAVELGAKYMIGLLNVFNFLRTGTVALTAQAAGRGDAEAQAATLARALAAAGVIGAGLLLLMPIAIPYGLDLLEAHGSLRAEAGRYVAIRYWSGPIWLANCVLVGWLIGRRRVRAVLVVEVAANAAHIALDLTLVMGFELGVTGVAVATVSSEVLKCALLAALVLREPEARHALAAARRRSTWATQALRALFAINRDLFLRTVLLTAAMLLLARSGAQRGPVMLAANGILFQLFMLATLILDGFESAAQVLCGEALGARSRRRFDAALRAALVSGGAGALVLAAVALVAGRGLTAQFSTDAQVIAAAGAHSGWLVVLPLAGFASFVLDGVFVGAGWTRAMLGTMLLAMMVYVALLFAAVPLGNHGLWLAFTLFFVVRAAGQIAVLPRLLRRDLGEAGSSHPR